MAQAVGTTFEHSFNQDGSVTWRILEGEGKGASKTEKSFAALKANEKTWAISYLAASGHTLTVVLSLDNGSMVGFASNETSWYPLNGKFELVEQARQTGKTLFSCHTIDAI